MSVRCIFSPGFVGVPPNPCASKSAFLFFRAARPRAEDCSVLSCPGIGQLVTGSFKFAGGHVTPSPISTSRSARGVGMGPGLVRRARGGGGQVNHAHDHIHARSSNLSTRSRTRGQACTGFSGTHPQGHASKRASVCRVSAKLIPQHVANQLCWMAAHLHRTPPAPRRAAMQQHCFRAPVKGFAAT